MRPGAAAVVVAMVLVAMATTVVTAAEVPLVDTKDGRVSGIVEKSVQGREFDSFYGIPFARPPVGKLRFKDPESLPAWKGTREASVPAAQCLQFPFLAVGAGKVEASGEEDCLYLNVFTPKVKKERVLPVMVWIHGGAFFCGGAKEYLPHVLLDKDVVLVVVQYRLGVLGLFSRAILQSGTALCPWTTNNSPRKAALHVADVVGCSTDKGSKSLLKCLQEIDAPAFLQILADLREWNFLPLTFAPWVDGQYLPDHPAALVRDGRHAKVDIISGVTRDDGAIFHLDEAAGGSLLEDLQNNFSVTGPASLQSVDKSEDPVAVARMLYLHYMGTTHVTKAETDGLMRLLSHRHFAVCHDLTTAHHAHHLHPTKKTFRYELQHVAELSLWNLICLSCENNMVCHGDDLYYLFRGGPLLTPPIPNLKRPKDLQRPDDLALRDIITTLWTNFAATGNPTPDASLGFTWEPSTTDNLKYLSLKPSPSMQPDSRKEARKFHNSLPTQENIILHPHLVEGGSYEPEDATRPSKTEL
ncbi:Venom carboxylesterase-6 [Chionoecetes opilio]|uniref:Venom carboxylesterase-6 n=1 Tax=Chionoecetes opilio TaxID=41210 RepID=A0A8J4YV62_CHIOP|nr:Venom carboxylesterase-6 [Chionoecetes opilio]